MMKNLRGRNLKHPGCLIGVTLGVILGIIIAGVMASVYNVPLNTILWTWLAMILFWVHWAGLLVAVFRLAFPLKRREKSYHRMHHLNDRDRDERFQKGATS